MPGTGKPLSLPLEPGTRWPLGPAKAAISLHTGKKCGKFSTGHRINMILENFNFFFFLKQVSSHYGHGKRLVGT